MSLLYFIIFGLLLFGLIGAGGKKFRGTALFALAIGGAVNAGYFHAGNYPIQIFNMPFGIDSILYSVFIFCVVLMYLQNNKKEAYMLSASSVIAILLAGIFELVAKLLSKPYVPSFWDNFLNFAVSCVATIICVIAILETLDAFKRKNVIKNQYILMLIGMLIATILNSPIYITLYSLIVNKGDNLLTLTITSGIGKAICIPIALFTLFFVNLMDKGFKHAEEKKQTQVDKTI